MQQSKPWERDWSQQAPAPAPPPQPTPDRIYGQPKIPDPAEQQRLSMESERLRLSQAQEAREQEKGRAETEEKARRAAQSQSSAISSIEGVIAKIDAIEKDASDNSGWGETGVTGSVMRAIPGTPAYDLAENLKTIDANSAFSALQEMRNNSPTGGALGQVTEKELELLKSSIANLNPGQSQQQFLTNLREARSRYKAMLDRLRPGKGAGQPSQRDLSKEVAPNAAEAAVETLAGMRPSRFELTSEFGGVRLYYPDGRTQDVAVEDMADEFKYGEDYRAAYREKYGEDPPLSVRVTDDSGAPPSPPSPDDAQRDTTFGAVDAAVRGVADVSTVGLADEIAAAAQTILGGGTMRDNLQRERGVDRTDERVNPAARFGGQFSGALLSAALTPSWARPTSGKGFATAGAGAGAAYGYGSGEGGPVSADRLTNALQGGAAGAVTGYGLGKLGQRVGNSLAARAERRTADQSQRNALMQAADRQGVDLMPADVGGAMTRRMTAGAAQAPLSSGAIARAGQRVADQSRAARDRIASQAGEVLDPETAGEIARTGGTKFIQYTRDVGGRLYDRAEKLANNAKVMPKAALEVLDSAIERMSQNPAAQGGAQLSALQKLRQQLGAGSISVTGIRDMRTSLREAYMDEGLRSNSFQKVIKDVVDAASEDMAKGLTEQGLERAVGAFQTADRYWSGRVQMIDDFLEPIIGRNRSGEQVMQALEQASRSKGRQLQGFVRALPEQERQAVQATIISRLGTKRGDAEAADFSTDVFLSQWRALTPRAKATLFQGDARSALDDLARIAEGAKASNAFANRSNTSGALTAQMMLPGGALAGGPFGLATVALGQVGAGKLLASPKFARWLASAPRKGDAKTTRAWVDRLPTALGNSPAIRGEVQAFQQRLLESITMQPRIAAEEPDKPRQPVQ